MSFLLFFLYCFDGFFMAIIACSGIGFAFAVLIALAKSFARAKNLLLMLMYAAAGFVCYCLFIGDFYVAEWIGDRIHYGGQTAMLVGAIFPGIFALTIIPHFLRVAWKQTSGIHVESEI
jgi:hypothetical protein